MNRMPARVRQGATEVNGWPILDPGRMEWECWEDTRHMLPSRLRAAVRRGEVVQLTPIREGRPGWGVVYVRRLRPAAPRWRAPLIVAAVVLVVLAMLAWALYQVAQLLAAMVVPALGFLVAAWVALRLLGGHSAGCAGLHCPGCRG